MFIFFTYSFICFNNICINTQIFHAYSFINVMVRVAGFEPARYFYRKILSLLRTACFATPACLIKSLENFLFPFNMIIITYNHQIVKALIKLSFYFFLKFLFRCILKTVKKVYSLPFNFIVGKESFGNILRTLSKQGC